MQSNPACLLIAMACTGLAPAALAHPPPKIPRDQIPADMPPHIREQVEKLYSHRDSECTAGARALGAMGPEAASAAPFLASVLHRHKTCPTPNAAQESLKRIGSAAVEPTILALRSADRYGRRRAFEVLGHLRDRRAVPAIVSSIVDGFGGGRAEDALRRIGPPALEYLLVSIRDPAPQIRLAAAAALPAFASSNVVAVLAGVVADEDETVRLYALQAIERIQRDTRHGYSHVPSAESIFAAARSTDPTVRRFALKVLRGSEGEWDRKLKAFIAAIGDTDRAVALEAIDATGWFQKPSAARALTGAATRPDTLVRATVAKALGQTKQKEALPALRQLIADNSALVRENAIGAIADLEGHAAATTLTGVFETETDPMLRRKSVLLLGRWKNDQTKQALLPLLADPDHLVRFAVVDVLADFGPGGQDALLGAVTNENVVVRRYVLDKIRDRRGPEVAAAVLEVVADPDLSVRDKAIGILSRHWHTIEDLSPIRARLADPSTRVRAQAISVLSRYGDRESMEAFVAAAGDRNADVARSGVEACARFRLVDPLVKAMGHWDWRTRESAATALAGMDDPKAREALAKAMAGKSTRLRDVVTGAMRRAAPENRTPEMLVAMLRTQHSRDHDRRRAIDDLVKLGGRAVAPVTPLLKHEVPGIRIAALDVLARIGGSASVDAIVKGLGDKLPEVRTRAAAALGGMGDERAVEHLRSALYDGNVGVRESAAAALGAMGYASALGVLVSAAADTDWHMRCVATRGLGAFRDPMALDTVLSGLQDDHWYVRRAASEALGRMRERSVVPELAAALGDGHWSVRSSAFGALKAVTGEDLGKTPGAWYEWWGREMPNAEHGVRNGE